MCWGWNLHGQMGEPASERRDPAPLEGLPAASRIGAHGAVTCALVTGGHVACLGGDSPEHFGPWRFACPPAPTLARPLLP